MTTQKPSTPLAVVVAFLTVGTALAQSPSGPQLSPRQIVKNVIYNEMHPSAVNNVYWRYRLEKTSGSRQETRTVIETKSGSIDRLTAVAGQPLSGAQAANEAKRIVRFSHSPDEQRKAEEARRKDAEQCNTFLKMIPNAFVFEYAEQNANAIKLDFKPNPHFQPPSREGKVLQQMAGEMWVDARQQRLISISGQLMNDVRFVKRVEIAPGDWELTDLTVNMQGKALLFKNIAVQQKEVHSNFERMPDEITMADAVNVLLRHTLIASTR
ncbi:MAG: hypothetical protein DMG92_03470 [Acidobacteria bacterium]|nr:MAG: hypothetical protein DMG92_03470 [Acidobacteriota bacterium]